MYEELIKRLREAPNDWYDADLHYEAADAIEELRKERKTGEWCADYDYAEYDFDGSTPLPEPRKFQDGWQCSLCGGYSPSETNFCPNCGAKMMVEPPEEE